MPGCVALCPSRSPSRCPARWACRQGYSRKNGWQIAEHAPQAGPMACNACSRAPSGTRMACAMRCAAPSPRPCLSLLACPRRRQRSLLSPCWSLMKVAFPNAASTPRGRATILRHQWARRKLPGGRFSLLRHRAGPWPDRPRVVPARRLVR